MTAQKLRKSILQYAVQGKLVPQNPNDEPASELLKKIKAEKAQLLKDGKIKKEKPLPPITDEEKPFDLPEGWVWCRLGEMIQLLSGRDLEVKDYNSRNLGIPYITGASAIIENTLEVTRWTEYPIVISSKNDLLLSCKGTIGKLAFNHIGDCHIARQIMAIRAINASNQNMNFVNLTLSAFISLLLKQAKSMIPGITREHTLHFLFPLPPLEEQKRIVAKVDELMGLCDELEKAEQADKVLDKHFFDTLPKSILQSAVQGKLVPQNPNDEHASELFKRILKEKTELIKQGKIKKEKALPPITDEEKPFDLPEGWVWCRLGEMVYNHGQKTPTQAFSYIDIASINNKLQKLNDEETIIQAKNAPSRARKIVKQGDILYATVRPYLHNICIINKDFKEEPIASTGFAVLHPLQGVFGKFLFYYLFSPPFDEYANHTDNAKGTAYPAINDTRLYQGLIALPPLEEQKRIVEKVEELIGLCEELGKVGYITHL